MFMGPVHKTINIVHEQYPWDLDEDVGLTAESIGAAELETGKKLSDGGVTSRGMNFVDVYDNTARVWERDTPYGNNFRTFPENGPKNYF